MAIFFMALAVVSAIDGNAATAIVFALGAVIRWLCDDPV